MVKNEQGFNHGTLKSGVSHRCFCQLSRLLGENRAVIIKSMKSRIPADFQTFVNNDDNKTRIIDLSSDIWGLLGQLGPG